MAMAITTTKGLKTPVTHFGVCSRDAIRRVVMCLALLVICASTGCANLHRRMLVRSDPPGALLLVDGEEVGYTPVAIDFTYYATREFVLIKDGYETLTAMQKVSPPWYQRGPLEFVSDNFLPVHTRDNHEYTFTLNRQEIVSTEELRQRANDLRSAAQILPTPPVKKLGK